MTASAGQVTPSNAHAAAWLEDPRYHAAHVAALIAIPLLQLIANPGAFINPSSKSSIDAWVYPGFFLSLPSHLQRFGDTYYATRLSWVVPGFVIHRLLPPLAASYTLHLIFLYAVLFATYRLLTSGANRHIAMLATLLVAWSPGILAAIGWDYVDGAGIVFLVTTLLCLERAVAGHHHLAWSIAAGAAAACLVVTNLTLVALLPACGVFLLLRAGASRSRFVFVTAARAAAGALGMLAFFAVLNRALGGRWLFLEPSIRFAWAVYGGPNQWQEKAFYWSRAVWLPLPIFATVGAIASLVVPPRGEQVFGRALQATLLTAVAAWVLSDLVAHSTLLQNFYYTSYLVPLALIALPLQGDSLVAAGRLRSVVAVELLAGTALATAHGVFLWHGARLGRLVAWLSPSRPVHPLVIVTCLALIAGTLAVVSLRTVRHQTSRDLVFALAMALAFVAPHYWSSAGQGDPRREFETTVLAHRFITNQVGDRPVRFWYQRPEQTEPPFRSIACTYLWGWVLVNEEMPRLTREEAGTIKSGTRLVLLVNKQAEAADARAALRRFGFDYAVIAQQTFDRGGPAFSVLIANLSHMEPK